jgi:hypothetical protein
MSRKEATTGLIVVAAAWLIALLSALNGHGGAEDACAQDNVGIKPVFEVTLVIEGGGEMRFCNTGCALAYIKASRLVVEKITVRGEESGTTLPASDAYFAESEVYTHRESSNRIHVFSTLQDARAHAEQFNGRVVDCPF